MLGWDYSSSTRNIIASPLSATTGIFWPDNRNKLKETPPPAWGRPLAAEARSVRDGNTPTRVGKTHTPVTRMQSRY